LKSNGGKLKNRLERADLDNFGMDWKYKHPPGSNTKGDKTFNQGWKRDLSEMIDERSNQVENQPTG